MSLARIVGQERATGIALMWLRSGRLPHTILVSGPEGTGKRQLAVELVKAVLCTGPGDDACDECSACRKVQACVHPDVHYLAPVGPSRQNRDEDALKSEMQQAVTDFLSGAQAHASSAANIAREHLRLLQREMSYAPAEGRRRVAVILGAERMHPAGANSLLKILEEPPEKAIFVLVSAVPEQLLATIRSRCQRLALQPLRSQDIREKLSGEGFAADRIELAVRLAGGNLDRARAVGRGDLDDVHEHVERFLRAGAERNDGEYFSLVAELGARQARGELELFLELCAVYLRDLFLLSHGCEGLMVMQDGGGVVHQLGQVLTEDVVEVAALEVDRAMDYLTRNVNPNLVLADLWRCLRNEDVSSEKPRRPQGSPLQQHVLPSG